MNNVNWTESNLQAEFSTSTQQCIHVKEHFEQLRVTYQLNITTMHSSAGPLQANFNWSGQEMGGVKEVCQEETILAQQFELKCRLRIGYEQPIGKAI